MYACIKIKLLNLFIDTKIISVWCVGKRCIKGPSLERLFAFDDNIPGACTYIKQANAQKESKYTTHITQKLALNEGLLRICNL